MIDTRVIKRYSNRKLYDLKESRYVTLQEVASFLQEGDEVQIIDNKTQEDITKATLAQILYEQEKANQSNLSLAALKGIIRSSGEQIQKLASTAHQLRGEAERKMTTLREQAEKRMEKMGSEAKTVVEVTQTALDELTKAVDDRFKQLIGFPRMMTPEEELDEEPSLLEVLTAIQSRLEDLDKRLAALEKKKRK
jgi:polyhydroxyalkanoate synthesis repressor PhaR